MAELSKKIFIVDDDPVLAEMLRDHLVKMTNYDVTSFSSGEECLKHLDQFPGIVFLDFYLDSVNKDAMDGLQVLQEIKKASPESDVVMLSGQDKIQVAVDTMKYGAFDYIVKGESAFYRAEKAVFNIYRYKKLQGNATRYKNMSLWLAVGVAALIMLVMWLQLTGKISDMPGWS
ncbi:MAG: C4-dicarboxylate transport transcriptional regulatory protein DctD [Bacteroidetes bacterium ADurb.Bin397]|jgi:two-component system OmpR family response regulator|nr:response regulator [Bacteroidia bacterium]OQA04069.1 MAG: C4-dicarboxylate transport transcriptional regulatory protein DctD [Bacteroidetes bacterium ADurb.Bin397]